MSLLISTRSPTADFKDSLLEKAITNTAAKLAQVRKLGQVPEGPVLDVTYLISGKHEKPSFTGMNMGNYSVGQKTLYFERAVPVEMLNSSKAEEFVNAVLCDVVANADEFFAELKQDFDRLAWERTLKII